MEGSQTVELLVPVVNLLAHVHYPMIGSTSRAHSTRAPHRPWLSSPSCSRAMCRLLQLITASSKTTNDLLCENVWGWFKLHWYLSFRPMLWEMMRSSHLRRTSEFAPVQLQAGSTVRARSLSLCLSVSVSLSLSVCRPQEQEPTCFSSFLLPTKPQIPSISMALPADSKVENRSLLAWISETTVVPSVSTSIYCWEEHPQREINWTTISTRASRRPDPPSSFLFLALPSALILKTLQITPKCNTHTHTHTPAQLPPHCQTQKTKNQNSILQITQPKILKIVESTATFYFPRASRRRNRN
jgi:hypothetical protein